MVRVCEYVLDRCYIPRPDYCRKYPVDLEMKDRRWTESFSRAHDEKPNRIGRRARRRKGKDRAAVARRNANVEKSEEIISA